jgi:hypothetical protein
LKASVLSLKLVAKFDPQLYKEFNAELVKMDANYKKLNIDLATSPNQERVLRAMIRNLQIQTEVLNQQLSVIEQFNQSKKDQQNGTKIFKHRMLAINCSTSLSAPARLRRQTQLSHPAPPETRSTNGLLS